MKSSAIRLMAVVVTLSVLGVAGAQASTPGQKLKRGNANFFFAIAEVPSTISQVNHDHGPLAAATWGVFKGLGRGLMRKAVGIHEIVTWPIPFPKNYEPVMQPEFPGQSVTN